MEAYVVPRFGHWFGPIEKGSGLGFDDLMIND